MARLLDRFAPLGHVLDNPAARAALERLAPEVVGSPFAVSLREAPVGGVLELVLAPDAERAAELLAVVGNIEDTTEEPPEPPAIDPDPGYEGDAVPVASARVSLPGHAEQNTGVDVILHGPSHGNPFVDVELTAEFSHEGTTVKVGGFYDGEGRYVLRFMAPAAGRWAFVTSSTARSLHAVTGALSVSPGSTHGPVRAHGMSFAHADGTPYAAFGTTAYAWTHQDDALQEQTLRTLARSPFNKLRFSLFPKHFLYNSNEPSDFVFPRTADGGWDTQRFDLNYFRRLEQRIRQLDELGIQADLILFHPYDRWGFSHLPKAADDRYIRYVARRLGGLPNVWWSLANEYDLLTGKRREDWDRIAGILQSEDNGRHLISIHNWIEIFDYSAPWATHCSIQRGDSDMGKRIDEWRHSWGKPVIADEIGYDGDLDQGWGNLTGEEVVHRFWAGAVRGGYLTHGETFYSDDEVIWWSKGGTLRGESVERIRFLRQIIAESPTGRLEPLPSEFDAAWGGVKDEYILVYFGRHRPLFRDLVVPAGMRARIEIIDTWEQTIEEVAGFHEGTVRVGLPARPGIALRLRAAASPPQQEEAPTI